MVDMDKKEQILHYHRIDGLSQREVARRVGVSRKTVKRYITEYETSVWAGALRLGSSTALSSLEASFLMPDHLISTFQVAHTSEINLALCAKIHMSYGSKG